MNTTSCFKLAISVGSSYKIPKAALAFALDRRSCSTQSESIVTTHLSCNEKCNWHSEQSLSQKSRNSPRIWQAGAKN